MKKGFYIISATVAIALLAACSGAAETESEEEQVSENCIYSYDSTSTVFEWTGYKTTAKVAVKGSFNEMEITGPSLSSDDPIAMLKQLSFKMKTASVETANEVRNGKIANFFFGIFDGARRMVRPLASASPAAEPLEKSREALSEPRRTSSADTRATFDSGAGRPSGSRL